MEQLIRKELEEATELHTKLYSLIPGMIGAAEAIIHSYRNGGKLIAFGNGGSAADAQHIVAELTGRFLRERSPLPAIALTTNTSVLTAIANDYSYEQVFSRQVRAFAGRNDTVIGISTSGKSRNVIDALSAARDAGAVTVGMTGINGFPTGTVDIELKVPSSNTQRIQECHILIGHIICGLVESSLFK